MLRLRVEVPDRPGSLAGVTHAVASCGADIVHLAVMHRDGNTAVDDLWLPRAAEAIAEHVAAAVEKLPGVRVLGSRLGAVPIEFDTQLDFLAYLFAAPQRSVEAFVEMLPAVTDADWAVIRDALTNLPQHGSHIEQYARPSDHVVEIPAPGELTVVVGRDSGLPWHDAEIRRVVSVLELASVLIATGSAMALPQQSLLTKRFATAYHAAPA